MIVKTPLQLLSVGHNNKLTIVDDKNPKLSQRNLLRNRSWSRTFLLVNAVRHSAWLTLEATENTNQVLLNFLFLFSCQKRKKRVNRVEGGKNCKREVFSVMNFQLMTRRGRETRKISPYIRVNPIFSVLACSSAECRSYKNRNQSTNITGGDLRHTGAEYIIKLLIK